MYASDGFIIHWQISGLYCINSAKYRQIPSIAEQNLHKSNSAIYIETFSNELSHDVYELGVNSITILLFYAGSLFYLHICINCYKECH